MAAARVLVVDDDPLVLSVTSLTLRKRGYVVTTAANGTRALEVVQIPPAPDLAISDAVMPGMPGVELLERVRQVSPSTALMLISGYMEGPPPANVCFLEKPFTPGALIAAVERTLAEAAEAREDLARAVKRSEELRLKARRIVREANHVFQESAEALDAALKLLGRQNKP